MICVTASAYKCIISLFPTCFVKEGEKEKSLGHIIDYSQKYILAMLGRNEHKFQYVMAVVFSL